MAAYELGVELLDQPPARSPLYLPSPHLGVISLLLGLFYALLPPPRASNSAFTETCKFTGVYLGTLVAGSVEVRVRIKVSVRVRVRLKSRHPVSARARPRKVAPPHAVPPTRAKWSSLSTRTWYRGRV